MKFKIGDYFITISSENIGVIVDITNNIYYFRWVQLDRSRVDNFNEYKIFQDLLDPMVRKLSNEEAMIYLLEV